MKKKVLLGMSGGVDSSVAAMLLIEQGFEVTGITFLFSDPDGSADKQISEARTLAQKMGFNHITADLREEFQNTVIHYFIDEYLKGRTPFPCAWCNPKMKFRHLEEHARKLGCEFISTGHYVQTKTYNGKKFIVQGIDSEKDQSFFLWGLKSELVQKLIFPLGNFTKTEIRDYAKRKGFVSLSKKRDSLGICFIEGNDYRKFLQKEGVKTMPGNFVDKEGAVLGKHKGITNYTIGQRRGLGINLNFPVFVSEIRLDDNEIVLEKYAELYRSKLQIKNYYIVDNQKDMEEKEYVVKVRYRLQETPCRIHILSDTVAEVELLNSEAMIAPGQTAVFYDGERLVGGGFIEWAK